MNTSMINEVMLPRFYFQVEVAVGTEYSSGLYLMTKTISACWQEPPTTQPLAEAAVQIILHIQNSDHKPEILSSRTQHSWSRFLRPALIYFLCPILLFFHFLYLTLVAKHCPCQISAQSYERGRHVEAQTLTRGHHLV